MKTILPVCLSLILTVAAIAEDRPKLAEVRAFFPYASKTWNPEIQKEEDGLRASLLKLRREQLKAEKDPKTRAAISKEIAYYGKKTNPVLRELARPYAQGSIGRICAVSGFTGFEVETVVSGSEFIGRFSDEQVCFRGFNTAGLSTGDEAFPWGAVRVTGTMSFTTVLGAKRTVPVVEPFDTGELLKTEVAAAESKVQK